MDEIFGRRNFNVVWEKVFASKNSSQYFSTNHDHLLVYAQALGSWKRNLLPRSEAQEIDYKNPDNDSRGPWNSVALSARNFYSLGQWSTTTPSGRLIAGPPKGRYWTVSPDKFSELCKDNRIWWGQKGEGVPRRKVFLSEVQGGIVPPTIWAHQVAGNTQEAKKEVLAGVPSDVDVFATPKPEKLLHQVLTVATNPGDLVLDSFVGSGTTCAVAHKMGRRYIGIEMGEHAVTHCVPRLKKVIDGEQGGISRAVNWQGGGGFRFYRLGEAVFDETGKINSNIRFATLAAHVWFCETKTTLGRKTDSPLVGVHNETAYYLLFNGILGDKRPEGGNVLTSKVLKALPSFEGPKVIYGETTRLGPERLRSEGILFKQIPYDIKAR